MKTKRESLERVKDTLGMNECLHVAGSRRTIDMEQFVKNRSVSFQKQSIKSLKLPSKSRRNGSISKVLKINISKMTNSDSSFKTIVGNNKIMKSVSNHHKKGRKRKDFDTLEAIDTYNDILNSSPRFDYKEVKPKEVRFNSQLVSFHHPEVSVKLTKNFKERFLQPQNMDYKVLGASKQFLSGLDIHSTFQ